MGEIMNNYTSELSELNKQNQELKNALYDVEVRIGHNLVKNSNSTIEADLKSKYLSIQNDLETATKDLETLKELEKAINEAEAEIASERKNISELEKKLDSKFLDLGNTLYEHYDSSLASNFGVQYAEISEEIKTIEDINIQKEILKQEMEKQGFFTKLMTQTKIAGLNMSVSSHTKKKEDALKKGAKICFENGVITAENGGDIYLECSNYKTLIENSTSRIAFLSDDLAKSKEKLSSMDKEKKIQQRIDDFTTDLNDTANQLGHIFDKQYVTRDAEILAEFPEGFESDLKEVLELKKQLKIVHRNCEIVQLSGQIEAAEKSMESISDEMAENEAKIKELTERNENLSSRLSEAETAKLALIEKRAALEEEAKKDAEATNVNA